MLLFVRKSQNLDEGELLAVGPRPALQVHVGLVGLLDHVQGEGLALALVVVSELVGGLSIGDLVIPEPLENFLDLARELPTRNKLED